jgi:DNA (cytosine-5)-methyltransferase 1
MIYRGKKMKHGSLFSGIGGFDLAAEWMGWENMFHCEWNEFGQRVLNYYWPNAISYGDITKTDFSIWRGRIDVLTGGFPCQPYSHAGKRKGKEDERHLWPEMLRAIREIQPRWVVGENVAGLISWDGGLVFNEVQTDLEAQGYEVQAYVLPACAVNAPHRRDRVWFVAYSKSNGGSISCLGEQEIKQQFQARSNIDRSKDMGDVTNTDSNGLNRSNCEYEEQSGKRGINAQRDFEQMGGDATNPSSVRSQRSELNRSTTGKGQIKTDSRQFSGSICDKWQKFPTQPPICGGDDGLPRELDSITFSKWRNESIKAYGNAIVPQVAYQIFKAIEQFENELLRYK